MTTLQVQIKRIDKDLPLPEYKTAGAVAFDLYAREDTLVPAKGFGFVPNNIIMRIPAHYGLVIASRSSTPKRLQVIQANGIGIIDQDYCGEEDELKTCLYNLSDQDVLIKRGDRISQAMLVPLPSITFEEVDMMNAESRGGFGTTTSGDLSRTS